MRGNPLDQTIMKSITDMNEETPLNQRTCETCQPGTPHLEDEEIQKFFSQLDKGWELVEAKKLRKTYPFDNFRDALDFTNRIGEMSEEEGHHPEITLSWGKVETTVHTHAIDALSENDFIWAAKADEIFAPEST